jgi:hypothetical protein
MEYLKKDDHTMTLRDTKTTEQDMDYGFLLEQKARIAAELVTVNALIAEADKLKLVKKPDSK